MSNKTDTDKRISHILEKIKNSIEKKSQIEAETKENSTASPNADNIVTSTEEYLTISTGTTLITDRKFINLNWVKKDHQGLTFRNCIISNSNFSALNLDGLRLENCKIFYSNFEKASIQYDFFEDAISLINKI